MVRRPAPYRPPHPVRRFVGVSVLAGVVVAGMLLPVAGAAALGARNASQQFNALPSVLDTPPLPQRSVIRAKDGSLIGEFFYQNRASVPLAEIAPVMREALVAIEDSRFYDHGGIDLRGSLRALQKNTSSGGVREGGSTITQQYVKQTLIENAKDDKERTEASARNVSRKLREARLALALEQKFSKDEILERYLNTVFFGSGSYGVQAAAQTYFAKSSNQLTLVEAATLAGIVQQPVRFDPSQNPKTSEARRNAVISRMRDLGDITPAEATAAIATPLPKTLKLTQRSNGCSLSYAPFFCDFVVRSIQLDPTFGKTPAAREALLKRGGLNILTTLDPKIQRAAQTAVNEAIPYNDSSGMATAAVTVEPGTGHILAMAQNYKWGLAGRGYTNVNFGVDTQFGGSLGAQAGSTFKIFTLAAALDQGLSINTTLNSPQRKTFYGFKSCKNGRDLAPYSVSNSTGSGTYTMRRATANSVNTYFVGLEQKTGICPVADLAESVGVKLATGKSLQRYASLTLGTQAVSPLAMANAYATFAARGVHCNPSPFVGITDRDGRTVPIPPDGCQQIVRQATADAVNQLLTAVMTEGTGRALKIGRPVAGKTGTIEQNAAVWFIGHTPQVATAVWIGHPKGGKNNPIRDITINGQFVTRGYGGQLAGPIWRKIMISAVEGQPVVRFPQPNPAYISGLPTQVPDVRGLDPTAATNALLAAGLTTELRQFRVTSTQYPEGTVASTYPGAGARVLSGRTVSIALSDGLPQPILPPGYVQTSPVAPPIP